MKKKRKVHGGRAILVGVCSVLALILLCVAIYGGFQFVRDQQHQSAMHNEIQEIINTRKNFVSAVDGVSKPADVKQETFDALKKGALTDTDFSILDQYNPDARVEESYYEQVKSLSNLEGDPEYASLFLNIHEYPEDSLEYFLNDTDRYSFVKEYPQRASLQTFSGPLSEDLNSVPQLLQWDTRWGYVPYGDADIAIAGCAPTCLSMVLSYLKQDPSITPPAVAAYSEANGYYIDGIGTAHALLSDAADHYGVSWEGIPVAESTVKEALDQGKLLILNMVPGTFTRVGHFIVVTGEEDGKLKVYDPNSEKRSTLWDYDDVLGETVAIWAYSK